MSNYDEIKAAIEDETTIPSWAIQGYYDGETNPRTFLAYVLGESHTKPGKRLSVLGYQYAGPHTSTNDARKWRCFKVDSFSSTPPTALKKIKLNPPAGLTIPPPLTSDELKRQNCVDIPGGRIERKVIYKP